LPKSRSDCRQISRGWARFMPNYPTLSALISEISRGWAHHLTASPDPQRIDLRNCEAIL